MFADYLIQSLLGILAVSFVFQLYYLLFVHLRLVRFRKKAQDNQVQHPVSVIICARNEAENLRENLITILEQDYPDFEVVVVNDCSWDETEDVLREFTGQFSNLKVVTVPPHERFNRNKKFALTMGIKAAQHEHLLFTEVNCQASSKKWIKDMSANFNEQTEIILGYTLYQKLSGLGNFIIRYETFMQSLNYLAYALKGTAYMGIGSNMAYLKSVFFKGKGFASHMHIPFGDDQLFVNQHANKYNTTIAIKPQAQIKCVSPISFLQYLKQRMVQIQVAKAFKKQSKLKLAFQAGSGIAFYLCLFTLLALGFNWQIILAVYALRLTIQFAIYYAAFRKLSCVELRWWLPVLDFIYYIYVLALSIATLFNIKNQWK